jgi:hypothetical protein
LLGRGLTLAIFRAERYAVGLEELRVIFLRTFSFLEPFSLELVGLATKVWLGRPVGVTVFSGAIVTFCLEGFIYSEPSSSSS